MSEYLNNLYLPMIWLVDQIIQADINFFLKNLPANIYLFKVNDRDKYMLTGLLWVKVITESLTHFMPLEWSYTLWKHIPIPPETSVF